MARLELERFLDKEVSRVYIAAELAESKRVEDALTTQSIDYAVELEPYQQPAMMIFSSGVYAGAAFYVLSGQAALARNALLAAGLKRGIQDDERD